MHHLTTTAKGNVILNIELKAIVIIPYTSFCLKQSLIAPKKKEEKNHTHGLTDMTARNIAQKDDEKIYMKDKRGKCTK